MTREEKVALLMEELIGKVTKRETLPNSSVELKGETEATYFQVAREFLDTSICYSIMNNTQDIYAEECYAGKRLQRTDK